MASGTTPSDSAQTGNIGDGKPLHIGETNAGPQTLLRLPGFTAVFEEVEQEHEVLGADPLTTVSDQFCWSLLEGPMAIAASRPRGVWTSRKHQAKCTARCMNLLSVKPPHVCFL